MIIIYSLLKEKMIKKEKKMNSKQACVQSARLTHPILNKEKLIPAVAVNTYKKKVFFYFYFFLKRKK